MKSKLTIFIMMLAFLTLGAMVGCGGGGSSSEAVNYEGMNLPAVIGTNDTAAMTSLAKSAAMAAQEAEGANPLSVGTVRMPSDPGEMIAYAKGMLSGSSSSSTGGAQPLGVAEPLSMACLPAETMTDGSGGYITMEYCYSSSSERITLTAVDYDDGFEAMDGTIIIEGTSTNLTIIFRDYYYYDYISQDFYADGIVTYTENSATHITITYDLCMFDFEVVGGFWLNNYSLDVDEDTLNEEDTVTFSGRFYDFDEGYVDVETVTPIVVPWYQDYPISGELQLTGDSGHWIKIRFRLNVTTPEYQVEINVDDDPDYEWISSWEPWVIT